ncbi:MAG: protein translocase subunit SecF, partial [Burkholderiaceae bacterium]|nr:protein translocase subunit SecF [Burkholderiaceae bacterium]
MEFFRISRDIPFMRHALVFNVISVITFALAVFFLATRGLHFSIEFTGGTVMEVAYPQAADLPRIRSTVEGMGFADSQVQTFGTSRDVMIRLAVRKGETSSRQSEQVITRLRADDPGAELRRVEFVGPQVGAELATDGALALLFVVVGIMLYLAMRFEWKFAVAAIIANLHDV